MSSANDLEHSQSTDTRALAPQAPPRWSRLCTIILLLFLVVFFGFLGYQAELVLPAHPPNLSKGEVAYLPDIQKMEQEVDAALLSWAPGNFVSNGDLVNNSAKIPSSYTHDAYPYAWSGVASIGWFHGLTTLNNAVFGLNADPTTTAEAAETLLGIDKETYLGAMFQNVASPEFRLPEGVRPSEFFEQVDPTPGTPGINWTIKMPGYPRGSLFMQNGLMAAKPGLPVAAQLNGMSAWQNTLAPPPVKTSDRASVERGAKVFTQANCATCHSGRYFTNHKVIPQKEVGTQPARAPASTAFATKLFVPPQTYPSTVSVPLLPDPPVLPVLTDITPQEDINLSYALSDPAGGYKVTKLIGLYLHAPYLHDGGVAAGAGALKQDTNGHFRIADQNQIGMVGTLMQGIKPDAAASLRMLLDRRLREPMIAVNQANPDLQRSNVDGSGHAYWVDEAAGFKPQEQTLPDTRRTAGQRHNQALCLALFTLAVVAGNRGFLAIGHWLKADHAETAHQQRAWSH